MWLYAVGIEDEAEASQNYVLALEDAVTDIDVNTVINVFQTDMAKEKFEE